MRRRCVAYGCFAVAVAFLPVPAAFFSIVAQAQPAAEELSEQSEEARQLFVLARTAFDERRYLEARGLLERSLELAPRGATAINLARVLRALGEPIEAGGLLEALLANHYGQISDERRVAAEAIVQELNHEVGTLVLVGLDDERATLRIDGARIGSPSGSILERRLNPGEHRVVAVAPDGRVFESAFGLSPGERFQLEVVFDGPAEAPEPESGGSVFASPWFWIGVTAMIAVGGGVLAFFLTRDDSVRELERDPQEIFPVIEALRFEGP